MVYLDDKTPVFRVNNLKVNRIQTGKDEGVNIRDIPVTKGLMNLLMEMGYNKKKGINEYILERENDISTQYMMRFISQGFGHFIKLATTRKIQFKDLRKTYITKAVMVLGDKAKTFTGHAGDEVLKNHYIANAYLVADLGNFSVFDK